ncbi:hypothetical protein D3C83_126130 [compost metagenome]
MRERVGADHAGDFDLSLGDERASHRGAEQVLAAVNRARAHRGIDEVRDELFTEIFDVALVGA